jgi:hypothetical protein
MRHRGASTAAQLLALTSGALVSAAARAQSPATDAELVWQAPPSCFSREAVLTETARLLASAAQRNPVQARADVAREDSGQWIATLTVSARGETSQRVLRAESCGGIASAVAVVLAVAIEGPPEEAERPPPRDAAREPPPAPSSPSSAPTSGSKLLVGGAGVLSEGVMPSSVLGIEETVGWLAWTPTWRVRSLAVVQAYGPGPTVQGEGGRFVLWTAGLQECLDRAVGRMEVGPCAISELASMVGLSVGAQKPSHGSAAWVMAGASVHGAWRFTGALAVFARFDGLAALARPTFVIQSPPPKSDIVVHRPEPFAAQASLGLEARFF